MIFLQWTLLEVRNKIFPVQFKNIIKLDPMDGEGEKV